MSALYSDLNQYPDQIPGGIVTDVQDIFQHLDNLFAINKREVLFDPGVGADLDSMLFELVDDVTSIGIYSILISSIQQWEPRVSIISNLSNVTPDPDNNLYNIRIVFTLVGFANGFEYSGVLLSKYTG